MAELGAGTGSGYPAVLDTDTNQEVNSPNAARTKARAEVANDLAAAIIAIETELGTDPAGTLTDVKTFLQTEHDADGTHNTPSIASFANATHNHSNAAGGGRFAGQIVQIVHSQTGAVATGTTVLPGDDTIPQNTEGNEYMTLAITPTSATNKLLIETLANVSFTVANAFMASALFQDSTANALAVCGGNVSASGAGIGLDLTHEMVAGTTSATTFKIRCGGNQAGTTTFNGTGGGRLFGGIFSSFMRITEIQV